MIFRTIVITIALLLATTSALACSCAFGGAGVCQAYWDTPAVFSGRVVEIEEIKRGKDEGYFLSKKIRFAVIDAYRGVTGETIEVFTGRGGGDCGYGFELNESYLVYAWGDASKLSTGICSRTKPLTAAAEDLAYIRGLAEAKPGATIFGTVIKRLAFRSDDERPRERTPMANIPISVSGDKENFETKTDSDGSFSLDGIPAGKYKVRPTVPTGFYGENTEQNVTVRDKGCAMAFFALEVDTHLSGRLTAADGQPAQTTLDLVPVEQINEKYPRDKENGEVDENGRYIFRNIPDGKYYLGTRLSAYSSLDFPYPRYFYPGTADVTKATVIEIHEGVLLENYDLQLPPKLGTRTISGKVTLPPGLSVKNVTICFEPDGSSSCQGDSDVEIKPDGSFKYTRFNGVKYVLRAYAGESSGKTWFAKPVPIPATGNVKGLKIVINSETRE